MCNAATCVKRRDNWCSKLMCNDFICTLGDFHQLEGVEWLQECEEDVAAQRIPHCVRLQRKQSSYTDGDGLNWHPAARARGWALHTLREERRGLHSTVRTVALQPYCTAPTAATGRTALTQG